MGSAPRILLAVTAPMAVNKLLGPLANGLADRGWEVHVVCGEGAIEEGVLDPRVRLRQMPMAREIRLTSDGRSLVAMTRSVGRIDPDVVLAGTPKAALLALVGAALHRVPVRVFHIRGVRWDGVEGRVGAVLRIVDRVTARAATHVLSVSDSLADLVLASGITRRRPDVIGRGGSRGVDLQRFRPQSRPGRPLTVGYVGRFSVDKGLQDAVALFHAARADHPDLRLLLVGEVDATQPIDATLAGALQAPGIVVRGPTRQVEDVLAEIDLLAFPSRREGLPNVPLEAAACAVPTVGYDVTGVRDCVIDGITGVLSPRGDVQGFLAAGCRLLDDDADREQMGRAARSFVAEHFDTTVVVAGICDYLAAALRPGRSAPADLDPTAVRAAPAVPERR